MSDEKNKGFPKPSDKKSKETETETETETEFKPEPISRRRLLELSNIMRDIKIEVDAMSDKDRKTLEDLIENPQKPEPEPVQATLAQCNNVSNGMSVKKAKSLK